MKFLFSFLISASFFIFNEAVAWTDPVTVYSSMGNDLQTPHLSLHPSNSTAVAVWTKNSGSDYTIQAAGFNGTSWSSPTDLGTSSETPRYQACLNQSGNALVVWQEFNEALYLASVLYDGTNWSNSEIVANLGGSYYNPFFNADYSPTGTGVVDWKTSDGRLSARTYLSSTWGTPYYLSEVGLSLVDTVAFPLAVSSSDWLYSVIFATDGVYTNVCSPTSPPSTPDDVKVSPYISSSVEPKMASVASQDRVAFAYQDANNIIAGVNFRPGLDASSWYFTVVKKDIVKDPAVKIDIALNPSNGRLAAIWQLTSGAIEASIYDGVRWTPYATLSTNGTSPSIAFNSTNNHAFAVWADLVAGGSDNTIMSSEWDRSSWSSSTSISAASSELDSPVIKTNSNGAALVLWQRLVSGDTIIEACFSE